MSRALVIARITWEENVRKKIFYFLLFLVLILLVGSRLATIFGMNTNSRLLKDFGLSGIHFFSLIFTFALFLQTISGEIDRKTIYPILAKPITRGEYLWGKFLGNMAILFVFLLVLSLSMEVLLYTLVKAWFPLLLQASFLIFIECGIVGALLIFLSIICSYPLALSLALLLYMIGNISPVYIKLVLSKHSNVVTQFLVDVFKPIMPQFSIFHIKNAVVHDYIIDPRYFPLAVFYGIIYTILVMQFAQILFRKREL